MKKHTLSLVVVLTSILLNLPASTAAPVSNSQAPLDYVVNDSALHRWAFGVYGIDRERTAKVKGSIFQMVLEQRKAMGYIGYNIMPWLMVYGVAGESENTPRGFLVQANYEAEYGVGIQCNLLDHEIPDPNLFENRIRINAGAQYTQTSTDYPGASWEWQEVLAYLTFSIVNDIAGNKLYLPNAVAIYAGPVYNDIVGGDLTQIGEEFGYNLGVEVFYTESVSFDIGIRKFDEMGVVGGMHLRF